MQLEPYVPRLVDIGRLRVDFDTGRIFTALGSKLTLPSWPRLDGHDAVDSTQ